MFSADDDFRSPLEPLLTGRRRGTVENRLWAKLVDFAVVEIILFGFQWFFPRPWIFLLAPLLWGLVEIWNEGQSPGKWLLGLQVVDSLGATYPNYTGCIVRNIPFTILSVCVFYFDTYIGFAGVMLSIFLLSLETYFVLLIQTGIRIGDVLSTTRVQDYRDQHMRFIEQYLKEDLD
jgi:uncharacterized RDD family membrane protein YckC